MYRLVLNHLYTSYDSPKRYPADSTQRLLLGPHDSDIMEVFALVIPRLVPMEPFLALCIGYKTDLGFTGLIKAPQSMLRTSTTSVEASFDPDKIPIKYNSDLLKYADHVAGSIASAVCCLSWSILRCTDDPAHATHPAQSYTHFGRAPSGTRTTAERRIDGQARLMGSSLQLVNIARDIAKDAKMGRCYIPLSHFSSASAVLSVLFPERYGRPNYALYTYPLLDLANRYRQKSAGTVRALPRTARGGVRAMVASYFEIAKAIRADNGEVDERGVYVSRSKRLKAAAWAFWVSWA